MRLDEAISLLGKHKEEFYLDSQRIRHKKLKDKDGFSCCPLNFLVHKLHGDTVKNTDTIGFATLLEMPAGDMYAIMLASDNVVGFTTWYNTRKKLLEVLELNDT